MMEESIDIPTRNGEVMREDVVRLFEQLGAPQAASLLARLTKLQEEVQGSYPVEEAVPALFSYVDKALREVVTSLSVLELAIKSDGQPRDVTVNLIEE